MRRQVGRELEIDPAILAQLEAERASLEGEQHTEVLFVDAEVVRADVNGSRAELEIAITEGHLRTPSRAKIDPCTADLRQTTTRRLLRILSGELDASALYINDGNLVDRSRVDLSKDSRVRRLFPDEVAEGQAYYAKTGFFPINHGVVVQRHVYEQYPWVALNIYNASRRILEMLQELLDERHACLPQFRRAVVAQNARPVQNLPDAQRLHVGYHRAYPARGVGERGDQSVDGRLGVRAGGSWLRQLRFRRVMRRPSFPDRLQWHCRSRRGPAPNRDCPPSPPKARNSR